MPETAPSRLRTMQAKSAAARRWQTPDRETLERDYAAERIAAHIEKVVASAPPLTDAQRDRLAGLLRGGGPVG